ncbi:acyl carrier protein [Saccharomonospora sp. CUA-673]|uniref:phosphopantetheine-binding protein n=1 Tax=Saccharomonospora sp. CUA-673 TaxID=1904969 RepID=UPI00095F3FED|nr:phosphopantetheine-binding protein [Saccharomonospora sp. CUA-673]OLT44715.1 acyl carrier protein [Saccharomonospora sp. CUA-673]
MTDPTTDTAAPTAETVRADVAELLGRDAASIGDDENLMDAGLDSIRIMSLIERWRAAGVDSVEFPDLAEQPELGHWISLVAEEDA